MDKTHTDFMALDAHTRTLENERLLREIKKNQEELLQKTGDQPQYRAVALSPEAELGCILVLTFAIMVWIAAEFWYFRRKNRK